MFMRRWNRWEHRLMDGEPQFTQAQVDAAVATAAADATGTLQKQLDELQKTNEALAGKVAEFEGKEGKTLEKLQKQVDTLTGERDTLRTENEGLAKVRDDWHADLKNRWGTIKTALGETDAGKKALESGGFRDGEEVADVQHNLTQHGHLVAIGFFEDASHSSPDPARHRRGNGEGSASDRSEAVLRKQFEGN